MAKMLMKVGEQQNTPYKQYIIDSTDDLVELDNKIGSIALCLANKKKYVCDSEGQWHEFDCSGRGAEYSAGDGIIIDDYEISIDEDYTATKSYVNTEVAKKVNINQGIVHAGKIMRVNASGNVEPDYYDAPLRVMLTWDGTSVTSDTNYGTIMAALMINRPVFAIYNDDTTGSFDNTYTVTIQGGIVVYQFMELNSVGALTEPVIICITHNSIEEFVRTKKVL